MVKKQVTVTFRAGTQERLGTLDVSALVIAGWTGRDRDALEKHLRELEELGVARPAAMPTFYRVSVARLTSGEVVEAAGDTSSGEVEFVLAQADGKLWVGVGSDHTDREVEAYGLTVSKQMCDKPFAPELWAFEDVADHWERLVLRSWITRDGERVLYQEGPVTAMLDPRELIAAYRDAGFSFADGTVMFCGTLAAREGIRAAERFEYELEDPELGRSVRHGYDVLCLPVAG